MLSADKQSFWPEGAFQTRGRRGELTAVENKAPIPCTRGSARASQFRQTPAGAKASGPGERGEVSALCAVASGDGEKYQAERSALHAPSHTPGKRHQIRQPPGWAVSQTEGGCGGLPLWCPVSFRRCWYCELIVTAKKASRWNERAMRTAQTLQSWRGLHEPIPVRCLDAVTPQLPGKRGRPSSL